MYSKEGCHLCDIAKDVLLDIQKSHPFEFRQVKLQEQDELFEEFKERFPVIFINDEFFCQYRVSEKSFVEKIQQINGSR
jgi:glutaredoxin